MDVFVSHKLLMYMLFSVTQSIYHCLFCLGIVYFSMNYASLEFCHILKRIYLYNHVHNKWGRYNHLLLISSSRSRVDNVNWSCSSGFLTHLA